MRIVRSAILQSLTLLSATIIYSQTNGIGSIRGSVVDESTRRPLEFVNIVLHNAADSAIVTGTVSDKNGKFEIKNVPSGEYLVTFSLISYKEKKTPSFKIDPQHSKLNVGTVGLTETMVSLDEVLVTSQRALFNNSIDRKVYNVEQDIMSKSGSASELLQNVPSIQVDIDGNVSLRGSSNVLILINGKNSPLMGKSRAEVLQEMPASSIEKIEVITNPSAKYNPDGTAGIINLVLKKNTALGVNGSLAANAGNNDRYNANIRLNYNPGDINIFGSYGVRKDNRNRINTDTRTQTDSASIPSYYREDLFSYAKPLSHIVSLGADYDIDKTNSAGISGNFFYNSFTRTENSTKVYQDNRKATTEQYERNRHDDEYEKEYGVKTFYEHDFDGEDHKLRVEYNASRQPEQEDNHFSNVYVIPFSETTFDNTLIKQDETKNEVSVDYSNPIDEVSSLEAGYSGEFNGIDMDFYAEYYDQSQSRFVKDVPKSNHFILHQSIQALYATYRRSFGKFGLLGGLRTEEALNTSNLVTMDTTIPNNYSNIYPSLHLSYKFSDRMEWQLNYSRRVHRPEGDDLNPFPEYRDARNISAGNPSLRPEYINSVEFGCKLQNDALSFLPSVYYRHTTNRFTPVTQAINDSTLLTTRQNLSSDQSAGVELIVSGNIGDWLTTHANGNAYYDQIDASNLGYSTGKSTITWSGAITCSINLSGTTMVQVNSNYSSRRLTAQGEYRPSYVVNLGFRQELVEGKLSLIATAADLFRTLKRESVLNAAMLTQTVVNTRDSRIIYLGLTYRFGAPPKKSNDDSLKYDDSL